MDSRPAYLGRGAERSLLRVPLGPGTLLEHAVARLREVTESPVVVLASFPVSPAYEAAIRGTPGVDRVLSADALAELVEGFEPSDWLLVADPRCFPTRGFQPASLLRHPAADPRWARHLVVLETSSLGTRECVEFGADGRVRRVQRYYETVTWPFTAGVSCSLLPATSALHRERLGFESLWALRTTLSEQGIPGRDLPLEGGAYDLGEERGLLALNEHFVLAAAAAAGAAGTGDELRGRDCSVHPSARLVGPVMLQDGVVIEEEAIVIGPALVGRGSRVERGAVVAQSLLGPETVIGPELTVRHRALFEELPRETPAVREVELPVYHSPTANLGEATREAESGSRLSVYARHKWLGEALLAGIGLLAISPLLLLIAALIKLESRGPVLFGHKREGKDGRLFKCWKFRSMFVGAEAQERQLAASSNLVDGPQFKMTADPRVTRMGRWLRPSSLDELPQLLNVVSGEMSLVGPRPSPFRENQICVPWREGRLSVRPGITGLWQVCRHHRSGGDFHQWIDYDLLYVRHISFWLDAKILIATVLSLGGRRHVPLPWMLSPKALQDAS